jgi:hypothetical protein
MTDGAGGLPDMISGSGDRANAAGTVPRTDAMNQCNHTTVTESIAAPDIVGSAGQHPFEAE